MNKNKFFFFKNKFVNEDLYLKLNYTNILELPKIKNISVDLKNKAKNKKNILFYITLLQLITLQKPYLVIQKKTKKLKQIKINLNKHKSYNFLFNLFCLNLPLLKNFKKINKNFFSKGILYYYITDQNVFFHNKYQTLSLLLLYLKKNLNIKIKITTKKNNICKLLTNLWLIP